MSKDYCSFSPEGNYGATCCKQHDADYENIHCGNSRLKADWDLSTCITNAAPHWLLRPLWGIIGAIYFTAVRIGGSPRFQKHICKFEKMPEWKEPQEV